MNQKGSQDYRQRAFELYKKYMLECHETSTSMGIEKKINIKKNEITHFLTHPEAYDAIAKQEIKECISLLQRWAQEHNLPRKIQKDIEKINTEFCNFEYKYRLNGVDGDITEDEYRKLRSLHEICYNREKKYPRGDKLFTPEMKEYTRLLRKWAYTQKIPIEEYRIDINENDMAGTFDNYVYYNIDPNKSAKIKLKTELIHAIVGGIGIIGGATIGAWLLTNYVINPISIWYNVDILHRELTQIDYEIMNLRTTQAPYVGAAIGVATYLAWLFRKI